jgi:hypothetical protein
VFDDGEPLRDDPDQAARHAISVSFECKRDGARPAAVAAEELTEGSDPLALEDISLTSPEYLALIHEEGVPDHEIALKVGAVIITVRSLSAHAGILNGTRLVVTHIQRNVVRCRRVRNPDDDPHLPLSYVCLPRIRFHVTRPHTALAFTRKQFPS